MYTAFTTWGHSVLIVSRVNVALQLRTQHQVSPSFCRNMLVEKYTILLLVILMVQASLIVRGTSFVISVYLTLTNIISLHTVFHQQRCLASRLHAIDSRDHRDGYHSSIDHTPTIVYIQLCCHAAPTPE